MRLEAYKRMVGPTDSYFCGDTAVNRSHPKSISCCGGGTLISAMPRLVTARCRERDVCGRGRTHRWAGHSIELHSRARHRERRPHNGDVLCHRRGWKWRGTSLGDCIDRPDPPNVVSSATLVHTRSTKTSLSHAWRKTLCRESRRIHVQMRALLRQPIATRRFREFRIRCKHPSVAPEIHRCSRTMKRLRPRRYLGRYGH